MPRAFTLIELWNAGPWPRFESGGMPPHSKRAFTLIELLVVITIIVVLLAILTPALDKAIYQAELAVCGANQKGIALGALAYASENKRRYPHRATISGGGWLRPNTLTAPLPPLPTLDDRPYLRNHMSLKLLVDPFAGKIDLEASKADSNAVSNYELWFGMRFTDQGGSGLYKIGDRLTWVETSTPPVTHSFSVLVSCEDKSFLAGQGGNLHNAHPDKDGTTAFFWAQDSQPQDGFGTGTVGDGNYTISRWDGPSRGTTDLNYAFDDGSVRRFDGVVMAHEPRMEKLPWVASGYTTTDLWTHLPLR